MVFSMESGTSAGSALQLPSPADLQGKLERVWAYLTIKEILKKRIETTDKDEKDRLKERALELSLQVHYNMIRQKACFLIMK